MKNAFIILIVVCLFASLAHAQEDYPNKPLKIVVGFGPGSIPDVATRILSESVSKGLGVEVIVEYKAGGSGMVSGDSVVKGKPDGYTILCGTIATHIFGPILAPGTPPYDPVKDFAPIAYAGEGPTVLVVSSQSPHKTFDDLIETARKKPGALSCSTVGVGSSGHFNLEVINLQTGARITHVPYKEGSMAMTAVLGGHMDTGIVSAPMAIPQVRAGKLRILVSSSRISEFPEVPTFKEKKLPQASFGAWVGYFVNAKTPKAIQDKLIPVFAKAIRDPENVNRLAKSGFIAEYVPPAEFIEMLKSQLEITTKAAKAAKITP